MVYAYAVGIRIDVVHTVHLVGMVFLPIGYNEFLGGHGGELYKRRAGGTDNNTSYGTAGTADGTFAV